MKALIPAIALAALSVPLVAQPITPAMPEVREVIGDPASAPQTGESAEQIIEETSAVVRCPVCQGLSIADSPSQMAVEMRGVVREMVHAGYSKEQILQYFATSYGEFVLLDPPRRGVNWIVWIAPLIILLAGAAILMRAIRRRAEPPAEAATEPAGETDPLLLRARAIGEGVSEGE
ncbi:MAG: cytochrome c-type biogenesis protein CcmH [Acidobacteria bacterium]|nr:cytochrome c-type biogenesis protein CcmH [Acidobacteriota bacterium]